MKRIMMALCAALALTASSATQAQENFTVATGDSKSGSTYSRMFRDLMARQAMKKTGLVLTEHETKGSAENVELLTGNLVNAAIVQSDMLFFLKTTDAAKVANIRTLVSLHPEELHFIVRGDVKKEGGFMGLGGKEVVFRTVEDLRGRNVGAVGGSVLSGRVFASYSKLAFNVLPYGSNTELTQALLESKLDTILIVAGAPADAVKALDTRFRVLPVTPVIATAVESVYSPSKLSYSNLGAAGVPTVATEAVLVTRTYHSAQMLNSLAKFRAAFLMELGNLQDARGTHPKWQLVNGDNKGKWPYYDLPAAK